MLTSYDHSLDASLGFRDEVFWKSNLTLPASKFASDVKSHSPPIDSCINILKIVVSEKS